MFEGESLVVLFYLSLVWSCLARTLPVSDKPHLLHLRFRLSNTSFSQAHLILVHLVLLLIKTRSLTNLSSPSTLPIDSNLISLVAKLA